MFQKCDISVQASLIIICLSSREFEGNKTLWEKKNHSGVEKYEMGDGI